MLQALRRLSHAANYRVARDVTDQIAARSALVLAPHPDDETLGCGATIVRKVEAGTPVTIAVLSDGSAFHDNGHLTREETATLRREETVEAVRRLGVPADALRWYGYPDGALGAHEAQLEDVVRDLVAQLRPDEVYVTGAFEPHPDHAAVGRAARRAVRGTGTRLMEYPIWLWTASPLAFGDGTGAVARGALPMLACRRVSKVSTDRYLDAKDHALAAHDSQLSRPADVPPGVAWPVLSQSVLRQARHSVELFLPWSP